VFSPGDICPDNNLLTPDGLRMLDFEGASFHSVFDDAAYARMPFATCWFVYALPDGLAAEIEELYRAEVVRVFPDLADDRIWRPGYARGGGLVDSLHVGGPAGQGDG
jgi:hypothetical protein